MILRYKEVIAKHELCIPRTRNTTNHTMPLAELVVFHARDFAVVGGDRIGITGSLPALGNWQTEQLLSMRQAQTPFWEAEACIITLA